MEKVFYCVDCGQPFYSKATKALRCPECRKEHAKEYRRQRKEGIYKRTPSKTLNEIMRELQVYNREHNTKLTYGQYVLKVEGVQANGKKK